ncbi:alpha/beta hydrolase-fold protein [Thermaerobacillus caldiproteolyticus]|uniref:alpha/beta hydrolase-fold protein n=1 Tax=Thermaerobacillus caldiproteolyticus TaxID=247480 RepID=UPI0018F11A89
MSFLSFMEEELKPMIDRTYRIDTRSQTIFGHSLGDLCCIHFYETFFLSDIHCWKCYLFIGMKSSY